MIPVVQIEIPFVCVYDPSKRSITLIVVVETFSSDCFPRYVDYGL